MNIRSKLPDVGTTIFTVMSRMAQESGAINLSQGFPDFEPPAALLEAVERHLRGGANQYAPMAGLPTLLEAIGDKLVDHYGHRTDPQTQVTVTPGATEALFCAIQAVVHPGQEVIVFDPAYDSYDPAIRLAGGRAVHLPLAAPHFAIDFDALADAMGPQTAMIVINSPHNPTGSTLDKAALERLAELVRDTDIVVLSDEVYEHIVFDGRRHASVLGLPELAARAFVVSSFGKTYHATGWKVGYVVAPPQLSREFRRVHQYCTFCVVHPIQAALADFMREQPGHVRELADFYQLRRDHFLHQMQASRFEMTPSAGTYFQLADYSRISDRPDTEVASWLTREHGVAVIPVSVFYQSPPEQRLVRFCFAKDRDTLSSAASRLVDL